MSWSSSGGEEVRPDCEVFGPATARQAPWSGTALRRVLLRTRARSCPIDLSRRPWTSPSASAMVAGQTGLRPQTRNRRPEYHHRAGVFRWARAAASSSSSSALLASPIASTCGRMLRTRSMRTVRRVCPAGESEPWPAPRRPPALPHGTTPEPCGQCMGQRRCGRRPP
jgi:hypothetical protein